jgi:drug/metabolite transporter (DMT)-like permease
MRFLKLYLIGYFILLFGAALALWQSGILAEIPGVWLAIGAVVAVGFGIMLAVASAPKVTTTTTHELD